MSPRAEGTSRAVRLRSWSPIPGRRGSRTTCGDGAGSLDKEEVRHCLIQERLSKQDLGNLPQEESIFAFWLTWGRWRRRSGTSRIPRRLFQTAQSPARNPSLWREPEPQDGKRRGGALSTAAVAAAESSGSLTGSQAPDPWASPRISSGVDRGAILGATNVWGEIGHLPVPVPSSSGERGRQGPIQQGARNRGESSVCGTCEHQQQQQQPYPRVHTCGDGDRARHKSILNEVGRDVDETLLMEKAPATGGKPARCLIRQGQYITVDAASGAVCCNVLREVVAWACSVEVAPCEGAVRCPQCAQQLQQQ